MSTGSYSVSLDRLMNNARVHLPGALDSAIKQELFAAVNEFMQITNIWKNEIQLTTRANTRCYEIEAPDDGNINRLMWVLRDYTPVAAAMSVPGELVLRHTPSEIYTLYVTVALTVKDPTTTDGYPFVPDWIIDKYATTDWLDGLLGRMMIQPAKPYSNKEMAVYHMRRWRGAMAAAKTEARHANVFDGQTWAYPQQFAVRHRR